MKQSFWARIAIKNIFENKKLHTANLVVGAFTVMTLYLYIFMATNPGLKNAKGYSSLKLMLYLGCVFLSLITLVFKNYTNRIFEKRRRKEMGLYAVWGLEPGHISSILAYEALYIYLASIFAGLLVGVILQKYIYESLFVLMKCNAQYETGFDLKNVWITMIIFFFIDAIILLKNMRNIRVQNVITLLKDENSDQVVKKLRTSDVVKGIIGIAMIAGAYIYVNVIDDFVNSISTIFIALVIIFCGSYLVISCLVIAIEFALKKRDNIYYKNRFFTTIAKLIARTGNNALSLVVINILFSCVAIGGATTVSLYMGTDRQASAAFTVDGEIKTIQKEDRDAVENIVRNVASKAGTEIEILRAYDHYAFPTVFDEVKGSFSNDNVPVRALPDLLCFIDLDDFNKYQNTELSLEDDEIFFISDEEVSPGSYDYIDVYGKKMKVKEIIDGPVFSQIDNIKYAYSFYVITKDYATIEMIREHMEKQDVHRLISHYVDYSTSGSTEDKMEVDRLLDEELRKIGSVNFFDSNITQKRTRYERNAIFLFLGTFISLIFVIYMIFIMYYKQIQEAVDDIDNVKIMQKIGMSEGEIKKSIFAESGILFFIPIVMAFIHVAACFGIICDVLKLFMLTDVAFAGRCISAFCMAIFLVYVIMYLGSCKVYINMVLHKD